MPRGKKRGGYGGRGGRGNKRGGGGGRENTWNNQQRVSFQDVNKKNEQLERYYNELNIVPEGTEREQFWEALRRELPNSFRFCGSKGHALSVQKNLNERFIPQITSIKFNDTFVDPPHPIAWYPANLAWFMTTPKNIIRKFAPFSAFQKFLVSETAVGNISRQEAVSMIPPLLLDVQPGHTVLDLCAAPGSKSAQLVEMVHAGEESRTRKARKESDKPAAVDGASEAIDPADEELEANDWSDDGRATGLLVANDVNYTRAQMLVHQVKRLNSPNLVVMNHDATMFPSIELPGEPATAGGKPKSKWLKFDRILADVPCSGDGTCRKNPNIWKDWIPGNGLGLYITQVRILVRSLQMLKVGGRVVYSTCSMNPVENEAVIASAIDRCGGSERVKLIDCSTQLPKLVRSHGLTDWKVMDKEGRIWNSWSDVEDAKATKFEASLERIVPGMFPPTSEKLPLDRCMRVYPHQQDTGGFFITVLEKLSEIKAKPESEAKKTNNTPSIVSVAKEIESKPAEAGVIPTLETIKDYAPTSTDVTMDQGNASAAQRQNKETLTEPEQEPTTATKRGIEDVGDAPTAAVKRAKVEKDATDAAPIGEAGQMEHWPPPPVVAQAANAPADSNEMEDMPDDGVARQFAAGGRPRRNNQPHEESFKYLDPNHPDLEHIYKFYEISPRFPRDRFMVRNPAGEPAKAIYYTTSLGKDILTKNEGRGMKFVHSGVKMFVKQDAQGQDICRWRIQSEGLPILEPWVGEGRIVKLKSRKTLQLLLREMFPRVSGDGWQQLGDIGEQVRDIGMGCCVLRVEPGEGEDSFSERLTLPLWRSISSLNLMLPKEERKAMLLRLYNDDTPLIDHSQERRQAQKDAAAADKKPAANGAAPDATNGGAEPETFEDSEDGGVKLNADLDEDMEDATVTAPVGEAGIDTEEGALMTEDKLRAEQQVIADEDQKVAAAPEREGETDEFNTTV